jgi:hypothetical protein
VATGRVWAIHTRHAPFAALCVAVLIQSQALEGGDG